MPTIDIRHARLHYEQSGSSGDPTVLIHGSMVDSTNFARIVPGLARGLTVLTYDRRGFGGSTPGPRPTPVETDAQDLAALLEATDFYPVHLVGHSYGAAVALRMAAERPELVRSLALHEPPFVGLLADRPESAAEGERFLRGIDSIRAQIRAGDREGAAQNVVEIFSLTGGAWDRLPHPVRVEFTNLMDRWSEEYGDPDAVRPRPGSLREMLVPALLTSGSESPTFLRQIRDRLVAEMPNPTVREIPHAGHAPQLTAPDAYVGLLLTFLLERNVPVS